MKYTSRLVDAELADRLAATGAVVIEGPKACGKTSTAESVAASSVFLDVDDAARAMIDVDPAAVLEGAVPRLIDEWQTKPAIWNHVRRAVDRRGAPGQFILTGSAVPADDVTRHTGTGRLTRLRMRPMSLFEMGRSTGEISLASLLRREPQRTQRSNIGIRELAELLCIGGWPGNLGRSLSQAMRANRFYLSEVKRVGVQRVEGKRRDPVKVGRLLQSLARNVATPAAVATLARDVRGTGPAFKASTAAEYMDVLERLMIVEDQPAWSPHLRSQTTLRTTPVRHFADPSLATTALRVHPVRLARDFDALGRLFKSMVIRDLRAYAQVSGAHVFHYREKDGLAVDAIVEDGDGRWAAFEVKLGDRRIKEGKANLARVASRMRASSSYGEPAALAVVVPSGYGAVPHGRVGVIPAGTLGP